MLTQNDFLMRFIDSYDVFIYSTNGVCSFLFGAIVFLLSKTLGVTQYDTAGNNPPPRPFGRWVGIWMILCVISIVATFASNFLIQGAIAGFFSDMYQQGMSHTSTTETDCKLESLDSPPNYFHICVRESKLKTLGKISLMSCFFAIFFMVVWLVMLIKKFIYNPQVTGDIT